jgi:hypothetical protein
MPPHQPSMKDLQSLSLGGSLRSGGHGLMRYAAFGHW